MFRRAMLIAQKNQLEPATKLDFDAVRLLREAGVDPFLARLCPARGDLRHGSRPPRRPPLLHPLRRMRSSCRGPRPSRAVRADALCRPLPRPAASLRVCPATRSSCRNGPVKADEAALDRTPARSEPGRRNPAACSRISQSRRRRRLALLCRAALCLRHAADPSWPAGISTMVATPIYSQCAPNSSSSRPVPPRRAAASSAASCSRAQAFATSHRFHCRAGLPAIARGDDVAWTPTWASAPTSKIAEHRHACSGLNRIRQPGSGLSRSIKKYLKISFDHDRRRDPDGRRWPPIRQLAAQWSEQLIKYAEEQVDHLTQPVAFADQMK